MRPYLKSFVCIQSMYLKQFLGGGGRGAMSADHHVRLSLRVHYLAERAFAPRSACFLLKKFQLLFFSFDTKIMAHINGHQEIIWPFWTQ